MIICFNCSKDTKASLDILLKIGKFKDYTEIISVAVHNLLVLQNEMMDKGEVLISDSTSSSAKIQTSKQAFKSSSGRKLLDSSLVDRNLPNIPPIFRLDAVPQSPPIKLAETPPDIWSFEQEIPLDRWIFGQYNKLLPTKANARALAVMLGKEPEGFAVSDISHKITGEAAKLGDYLTALDRSTGRGRDSALATAFPNTSKDGQKGRTRYTNHFVAYMNGQGQVSSLLVDYKLVGLIKLGEGARLLITPVGWDLARLPNPVLDLGNNNGTKFSIEEINFILNHIAKSMPVEAFAYRVILEAIKGGRDTPEKIDGALKPFVPRAGERNLSPSFLASQRSGAISRMADLELLVRKREGVWVSYALTQRGREFLARLSGNILTGGL